MVPGQLLRFFCFLLVPGVVCTVKVCAQSSGSFTTTCSAQKTGLADQVEITYTLRDIDNLVTFSPGALRDVTIVAGPFEHWSTAAFSGSTVRKTTEVAITYLVQPKRTGTVVIPPATAKDASGRSYQSNSVALQVSPGSARPARQRQNGMGQRQSSGYDPMVDPYFGNPVGIQRSVAPQQADLSREIFLRVEVDKTAVTVGEPIIASYKLFTRLPMEASVTRMPVLNGFWSEDYPIPTRPQPVSQMVNGRGYQTYLLKKIALYPTEAGNLTLDPAYAEGVVRLQRSGGDDPFGLADDPVFGSPFAGDPFGDYTYENVPMSMQSRPLTITVIPAPTAGRPENWNGAVGQFEVSSRLVQHTISEEDEALLQVIVRGSGNIALLKAPALRLPAGLQSSESGFKDTTFGTSGEKGRIFNFLISASQPAQYDIPPVELAYYDPETRSYRTASSSGASLRVREASEAAGMPGNVAAAAADTAQPASAPSRRSDEALTASPAFWAACSIPALLLIFLLARRKRRDDDPTPASASAPVQPAPPVFTQPQPTSSHQLLSVAGSALQAGQYAAFYRNTCTAVAASVRGVLGAPSIAQMSPFALQEALRGRGVPDHVSLAALEVMRACDSALYAPPDAVPDEQTARTILATAQSSVQQLSAFPQLATA